MNNKLKTLTLTLLAASTLFLTSCDQKTKDALQAVENKNPVEVSKTINADKNQANNNNDQVTQAVANKNTDVNANLGFAYLPEQIIRSLDEVRNAPAKVILKEVNTQYPSFLAQIAGISANSSEYNEIKNYIKTFQTNTEASSLGYSMHSFFANDVNDEGSFLVVSSDYPSLPSDKGTDDEYKQFKAEFAKVFKKKVADRLSVYETKDYQEKIYDGGYQEGNKAKAKEMIDGFLKVVDILTEKDPVCSAQSNPQTKGKCFVEYLERVSQFPSILVITAELNNSQVNQDELVSPVFRENTVNSLVSFYNAYVKHLNMDVFRTK